MALDPRMSNDLASAMLDNAVNTKLNGGLGDAIVNIYTGGQPANCEAAETGTLLGTCIMNVVPFGAATDQAPGARLTANAITAEISAVSAGTAGYFRAYSSDGGTDGSKLICHLQGTAGEAADTTDMTLDEKVIILGGTIQITAWTFDLPED
jgi:hypothetical protein